MTIFARRHVHLGRRAWPMQLPELVVPCSVCLPARRVLALIMGFASRAKPALSAREWLPPRLEGTMRASRMPAGATLEV
jgi:hypothetical protein